MDENQKTGSGKNRPSKIGQYKKGVYKESFNKYTLFLDDEVVKFLKDNNFKISEFTRQAMREKLDRDCKVTE